MCFILHVIGSQLRYKIRKNEQNKFDETKIIVIQREAKRNEKHVS